MLLDSTVIGHVIGHVIGYVIGYVIGHVIGQNTIFLRKMREDLVG